MLSFHAFLKRKTVKTTLLQTDNFQSDKKAPCPTWTNIKVLGISKKQRIKLVIFVNFLKKKHFFCNLEQPFSISSYSFWRSAILLTRTHYLFFEVALCNQSTIVFAPLKAISIFKLYCIPLWTIGFSTVTYIRLWWSVKDLQKIALKI